ncbi:hypothetical protein [Streptomyces sp. SID5910]|uniref:hypothetical protein n=1 Tax=Streptomyces sp. SID5910 TaxID=2690312 RepID=UPI001368CCCB|nr:hypothetical protein [Streptomyces sp. SID5910]MYR42089.1 hypothetical protein [Streptomyces sp. SID5910]
MASPYINAPLVPSRPRMFNSVPAKVIWTLVPVVTVSLCAAVPFVVAAVKGVIKPWLAAAYVAAEIAVLIVATVLDPKGDETSPVAGLLLVLLIITAATHTALLDHEKITVGK